MFITINSIKKTNIAQFKDVAESIEEEVLAMMYQTNSKLWACSACGKESKYKNDMRRHIESLHVQDHPGYKCDYCLTILNSSNALRLHVKNKHC